MQPSRNKGEEAAAECRCARRAARRRGRRGEGERLPGDGLRAAAGPTLPTGHGKAPDRSSHGDLGHRREPPGGPPTRAKPVQRLHAGRPPAEGGGEPPARPVQRIGGGEDGGAPGVAGATTAGPGDRRARPVRGLARGQRGQEGGAHGGPAPRGGAEGVREADGLRRGGAVVDVRVLRQRYARPPPRGGDRERGHGAKEAEQTPYHSTSTSSCA